MNICGKPLGASYETGVVVCILPEGHEGDCDGGEKEKLLGESFVAQRLQDYLDHNI